MSKTNHPDENLLRIEDVCEILRGVHRTAVYKWIRQGKFPKPVRLGRLIGWPADVVKEMSLKGLPPAGTYPVDTSQTTFVQSCPCCKASLTIDGGVIIKATEIPNDPSPKKRQRRRTTIPAAGQ
jgi:predicted DNA-binding transcriptional regulator AlpA